LHSLLQRQYVAVANAELVDAAAGATLDELVVAAYFFVTVVTVVVAVNFAFLYTIILFLYPNKYKNKILYKFFGRCNYVIITIELNI